MTSVLMLAMAAMLAAGCADEGGGNGTATSTVALREWAVEPDPASVGAGTVDFNIVNQGAETHELVVVRADSVDDLPVDENGAFDEAAYGAENVLGEVEDVATGTEESLSFQMEAGNYLLLCNIIEEEESGEIESHFANGMYASFTVEP
jgi:hypothetical protein